MVCSLRRIAIAILLAVPGLMIALSAKPLVLGEDIMLLGICLAFGLPVWWMRRPQVCIEPQSGDSTARA